MLYMTMLTYNNDLINWLIAKNASLYYCMDTKCNEHSFELHVVDGYIMCRSFICTGSCSAFIANLNSLTF